MTDRELMQQALEALGLVVWTNNPPVTDAIAALRERLARECCCGEPATTGIVHRTDGPCYVAEPAREEQDPWEQLHPDMGNPVARQEPTRAEKMREAGYTRRPSLREFPSDEPAREAGKQ